MSDTIDNDTPYWPDSLPLPLIERKRRCDPRSWNTLMESRRYRCRRQHLALLKLVDVSWNFTEDEYAIFQEFFIEQLNQGELLFAMVSIEPDSNPALQRTYIRGLSFWGGTYEFSRSDNLFTVSATLEIVVETFNIYIPFFVLADDSSGAEHVPFVDALGEAVEVLYE